MNKHEFHTATGYWEQWETEKYMQLTTQLDLTDSGESPLPMKLQRKLDLISQTLEELRIDVNERRFADEAEEIRFMKVIKPKFTGLQIFYGDWLLIESNLLKHTPKQVLNYYLEALNYNGWFIQLHYGLFRYYQLALTELDHLYFLRGPHTESSAHLPLADPSFGTPVSDLFARFTGMEKTREMLLSAIQEMDGLNLMGSWHPPFTGRRLRWTGPTVGLVEVIYGLYYTGQLNNGQATIRDITQFMEDVFQLPVADPYHVFLDIRERKRLSTTNLLDQMRAGILQVVDNSLAYKPRHMQSRS